MTDERKIFYENYVKDFKDLISLENEKEINSLKKHYKIKILPIVNEYGSETSILELGCGPGYTMEFLREEGFKNLKGIDISQQQIDKALAKSLDVELIDVFAFMDKSEQKYDIIIAFDFIEHFKKEEIQSLFNGISNHLNPNGALIIRTPNGQGIFSGKVIFGDLTHYTIFTPTSLTQILKLNGFINIYFFENSPVAKNVKGIMRKILWQMIKLGYNIIRIIEQGSSEKIVTQDFYCIAKKNS